MPRRAVLPLAILVLCVAIAQPGLCPCWALGKLPLWHPHLGDTDSRAHPHDYLDWLFQAIGPALPPPAAPNAQAMLSGLVRSALSRPLIMQWSLAIKAWALMPDPPPPRGKRSRPIHGAHNTATQARQKIEVKSY